MGVCLTMEGGIAVIVILGLMAAAFLMILNFTKEDEDVSDDNSDQ